MGARAADGHAGGVPGSSTTVYTDGACSGNPGPGGWAWAVPGGRFRSGAAAHTTNQRMELQAVLDAVGTIEGQLDVVSDSTYVVNCFRDRWWEGWLRRGWVNSQKKPVANRDLWEPLIAAYRADPGRVAFHWVKGHSNDPMNDVVDRLAVEAAATQTGREDTTPPDRLGAPDRPGPGGVPSAPPAHGGVAAGPGVAAGSGAGVAGAGAADGPGAAAGSGAGPDVRLPTGHLLAVTGLRPAGLGGFGETLQAGALREQLTAILAAKREVDPDLVVLTGLGLGAEQLAAEAATAASVPFVAVLAFPDPDRVWPPDSRQHYAALLEGATGVITLQAKAPDSKQAAGGALARRDAWLAAQADEAVVVWDQEDPFVGRTVRSWRDRLGEEQVWVLEP
jgi:ribonuclease HI